MCSAHDRQDPADASTDGQIDQGDRKGVRYSDQGRISRPFEDRLRAPFPYYGGKGRWADAIWQRLGSPGVYVEPFLGERCGAAAKPDRRRRVRWSAISTAISPTSTGADGGP